VWCREARQAAIASPRESECFVDEWITRAQCNLCTEGLARVTRGGWSRQRMRGSGLQFI
jgi:hypothetical protein